MYLKALLACHTSTDDGMTGKVMNGATQLTGIETFLDVDEHGVLAAVFVSSSICWYP